MDEPALGFTKKVQATRGDFPGSESQNQEAKLPHDLCGHYLSPLSSPRPLDTLLSEEKGGVQHNHHLVNQKQCITSFWYLKYVVEVRSTACVLCDLFYRYFWPSRGNLLLRTGDTGGRRDSWPPRAQDQRARKMESRGQPRLLS